MPLLGQSDRCELTEARACTGYEDSLGRHELSFDALRPDRMKNPIHDVVYCQWPDTLPAYKPGSHERTLDRDYVLFTSEAVGAHERRHGLTADAGPETPRAKSR